MRYDNRDRRRKNMKRKKLFYMLLVSALLAGCNARNTDTDTTIPARSTGESEDTADSESQLIPENEKSGSITALAVGVPAEINGKKFTITTEQAYPDDDEILAVNAIYGEQTLKLDESLGVKGIY